MRPALLHHRLPDLLWTAGWFDRHATVERATIAYSSLGEPLETWTPVPGMTGLPCALAPLSASERREQGYTASDRIFSALLPGAYPGLDDADRLVIDGVPYEIEAISDIRESLTALTLRLMEV